MVFLYITIGYLQYLDSLKPQASPTKAELKTQLAETEARNESLQEELDNLKKKKGNNISDYLRTEISEHKGFLLVMNYYI
jgi:cell division protein FtsB